jgi:hypothetical protein
MIRSWHKAETVASLSVRVLREFRRTNSPHSVVEEISISCGEFSHRLTRWQPLASRYAVSFSNKEKPARHKINIPEGTHDAVLLGEHHAMVVAWTNAIIPSEQSILTEFAIKGDKSMSESVGTLAYAAVSRTAWSLISVADIQQGEFDPAEFGRRCEAIAREQIERHRTATEAA